MYIWLVLLVGLLSQATAANRAKKPHIVMYVIDDLGWGDVGYLPSSSVHTPTIDSLAHSGVLLNRYYTAEKCSPSRAALLTGRYPFKLGLQHGVIVPGSPAALPLDQPTMAELLRDEGYHTALLGKWHMGYAHWGNTPRARGFSTFEGFYLGKGDYLTRMDSVTQGGKEVSGYDWRENETSVFHQEGVHNKDLYDKGLTRMLDERPEDKPMFLLYSQQLVHLPVESKPEWLEHCQHIKHPNRQQVCGHAYGADQGLKHLVEELKRKGMWDNTFLVVTTDNGGHIPNNADGGSINYPLRAGKGTLFEGGVRGVGFVNGGIVPDERRGTSVSELLHLVDWIPTFMALASSTSQNPTNLDGYDLRKCLFEGESLARESLPININRFTNRHGELSRDAAIISGEWKLILVHKTDHDRSVDWGWIPEPPLEIILSPENKTPGRFLFNIVLDPNEHNNVYESNLGIVEELLRMLENHEKEYMDPQDNKPRPEAHPSLHNGTWSPFLGSIA